MKHTKLLVAALALTSFCSVAQAGSLADPVVEPAIIVDDATSSSAGSTLVVALAYLILIPVLD